MSIEEVVRGRIPVASRRRGSCRRESSGVRRVSRTGPQGSSIKSKSIPLEPGNGVLRREDRPRFYTHGLHVVDGTWMRSRLLVIGQGEDTRPAEWNAAPKKRFDRVLNVQPGPAMAFRVLAVASPLDARGQLQLIRHESVTQGCRAHEHRRRVRGESVFAPG